MPKRKQRTESVPTEESNGRQKEVAPKKQRRSSRNQAAAEKGSEEQHRQLQLQDLPDNVIVQILRKMGLQRLKAMQGSPRAPYIPI